MIEDANKLIGVSPSIVWATIAGLIAAGIIGKLITDLIINYKNLRGPKVSDEKSIRDKLRKDHERLCSLEEITERQDGELKLILRSQMAMIHHTIDGNGVDKLKEIQGDIEDYLITGKIKKGG